MSNNDFFFNFVTIGDDCFSVRHNHGIPKSLNID